MKYLGSVIEDASLGLADVLSFVSWVENQLAEIVGESGFVGIESFLRSIFSSVINSDSDGFGELNSKSDTLDFSEGESFSGSGSVVVSDGLASD